MNATHTPHFPDKAAFRQLMFSMLAPEAPFFRVILIYSAAISLLSMAMPISVQILIDTIAKIGQISAVVTIGFLLFFLLMLSGVLYALRAWTMELYNRHLFSRMTAEMALTGVSARGNFFEEGGRPALFNRYFDIMTLKKNIPYLLSYGFSLFFQSLIGFLVVSLYHFYFFLFSMVLITLLAIIWHVWGWSATQAAFRLSDAKHATGAWLQGLAVNNGFFKPRGHLAFALARTDSLVHKHLDAQESHFGYSFRQLLSFLFIYAAASAVLLTIGGWLVIQGQLTMGQLVAAELIMSTIFYGLPQIAGYLDYYYDVCAAMEELHRFAAVDTVAAGAPNQAAGQQPADGLHVQAVQVESDGIRYRFTLSVAPGQSTRVCADDWRERRAFAALLKRAVLPESGSIRLGAHDLMDCDVSDLREWVISFERQTLLPLTIREYLTLADATAGASRVHAALALLNLDEELALLPAGLDTSLSHSGYPLVLDQALRLKLAFALLGGSTLLVLGSIFDCLPAREIDKFASAYTAGRRILLYFTHRDDLHGFDSDLHLGQSKPQVREEQKA